MFELKRRFRKDHNIIYRRIAQECLLVPIRQQAADLSCIYVFNPVVDRVSGYLLELKPEPDFWQVIDAF